MDKVRIGRRSYFSCGHSYRKEGLTVEESVELWGELYAKAGWGHNFVLDAVFLTDPPDKSGLSFSLAALDQSMQALTGQLDHTYLNTDVEFFHGQVPSLENIARYCLTTLQDLLKKQEAQGELTGLYLESVRLFEDDRTWINCFADSDELELTGVFKVSALHRHHNPDLSMLKNEELYHKCSTLHGHLYTLEVTARGPLQRDSQILIRREFLRESVAKAIVEPFHGSILNDIIGNTSGELIYKHWEKRLKKEMGAYYGGLLLRETRKNHFMAASVAESGN